jgi:hypothetical protein
MASQGARNPSPKFFSPYPFGGMNLLASPLSIGDNEFIWVENFVRLGDGKYRTAWDIGTPLYTVTGSATIIYYEFFSIGTSYYVAVFLSDGSAVQVDMSGNVTQIGPAGTFWVTGMLDLPCAINWGTQLLLIASRINQNAYWIWDGTLLYSVGGASPLGVNIVSGGNNYTTVPTVTAFGGNGSGMKFTTTVDGGAVSDIQITNPGSGYQVGDTVQLSFSGGGSDTSAILTANIAAGGVAAVEVNSPGSGYTTSFAVSFSGGGGTGAAGTANVSGGQVTGVTITAAGTGYTSAPVVSFSAGSGTGAGGYALLNTAGVTSVMVVNGGSGYTHAPSVTFEGGGGAGATGICQLTGTSIASINIVAGGSGYQVAPTVIISGGGGGSGASATATIAQGQVVKIDVDMGGTNYTTQPLVYIQPANYGTSTQDTGTGAAAQAVLTPTSINSVIVSSSGKGYTTAPAVVLGSGANNAASATVSLMPFGISGAAINTYQQRVWIANPAVVPTQTVPPGGQFSVSAPGSYTDFASSDGGVLFTNSDNFLNTKYTAIHQSNGYLYMLGDGSVSIISSVNTSGNPATTTFNYQNVDPQTGALFPNSVQDFGKTILFGNETGVFGIYGGSATLASAKLNDLFLTLDTSSITPSSASATLFDVKHYLMLMTITDPVLLTPRTVMIAWNEKDWTVLTQDAALTFIGTQKIGSTLYAWGTDGTSIYPLFNQPSSSLTKRLDTKIYGGGNSNWVFKDIQYMYIQAQDQSAAQVGIEWNVDLITSGVTPQPSDPDIYMTPSAVLPGSQLWNYTASFAAPQPYWPVFATRTGGVSCLNMGARLTTSSPDFILADWRFLHYETDTFTMGS